MTFSEQDKKTFIIGLFIAILIIAGSVYFYIMFIKKETAKNTQESEKMKKELKGIETDLLMMQKFIGNEGKINQMKKKVEAASKRLPNSPEAYEFLEELISVLRISKVNQHQLIPQKYKAQSVYTEIPYSIGLRARFHEYGTFLNLVEENPNRFMRINSFHIINDTKRPSIHPVTVGISTFMFNRRTK